jgi:hypothetical protein
VPQLSRHSKREDFDCAVILGSIQIWQSKLKDLHTDQGDSETETSGNGVVWLRWIVEMNVPELNTAFDIERNPG